MSAGYAAFVEAFVKPLYVHGIDIIQGVQRNLKVYEWIFSIVHQSCDPWVIHFVFFPIVYYINMKMGLRILWSAALTEFICIIIRLLGHGQRPYWWVYDSPYHITAPRLAQFSLTCETTPATPSDRAMVAVCVSFLTIYHFCRFQGLSVINKRYYYVVIWGMHYSFQLLILISSAFYAVSFPHQILISCLMGNMMARRLVRTDVMSISLAVFVWTVFFMLSSYTLLTGTMWILGMDPTWAGGKASMACMKMKWLDVYHDLNLEQTIRASGLVLGMGLAINYFPAGSIKMTDGCLLRVRLTHAFVGVLLLFMYDAFIQPPFRAPSLYYIFQFVKYTVPPIIIIVDIPFITAVAKFIGSGLVDGEKEEGKVSGDTHMGNESTQADRPSRHHCKKHIRS